MFGYYMESDSQKMILSWLESPQCRGCLIAPPCGTASASRNIRLPHLRRGGPKILRTPQELEGLANLSPTENIRVEQANRIYCFVQEVVEFCFDQKIPVVVENPLNSLYWQTRWWAGLKCLVDVLYARHQACAYGGRRPKNTLLAFNRTPFLEIDALCPGDHEHLPWGLVGGRWATSFEAHYPPGLCRALARGFLKCALEDGLQLPPTSLREVQVSSRDFLQVVRVVMHEPVKAAKVPPLVSEYKCVLTLVAPCRDLPSISPVSRLDAQWELQEHVQCSDLHFPLSFLPDGAQLMRHVKKGRTMTTYVNKRGAYPGA